MDLIPAFAGEHVLETGQIYLPAGNGKVAAVLRAELAEAAAAVVLGQGHENRVYNFSNSTSFSYHDVADAIHAITGKEIGYTSPTAGEYVDTLRKYQVPEEYIGVFTGFAVAQDQGELEDTGNKLEELLGRKPTVRRSLLSGVYA
jgi:NAD(P)H dehydrogenase (quinone)